MLQIQFCTEMPLLRYKLGCEMHLVLKRAFCGTKRPADGIRGHQIRGNLNLELCRITFSGIILSATQAKRNTHTFSGEPKSAVRERDLECEV